LRRHLRTACRDVRTLTSQRCNGFNKYFFQRQNGIHRRSNVQLLLPQECPMPFVSMPERHSPTFELLSSSQNLESASTRFNARTAFTDVRTPSKNRMPQPRQQVSIPERHTPTFQQRMRPRITARLSL